MKKSPWTVFVCGTECRTCGVYEQLGVVRLAITPAWLKEVIGWPDTPKTVRRAAEARLRKLTKLSKAGCVLLEM